MPTIPMIVPLLVTGILFGYILRTKKTNVGRKLTALGCLLGGVGNAVNGAILYLFQSQATTGPSIPPFVRQASAQTPVSFLILSFVAGALIVLLVLVPAVLVQTRTSPHLPFRRRQE